MYKRQGEGGYEIELAGCLPAEHGFQSVGPAAGCRGECFVAVSYTPLDVYTRQAIRSS